ncbi:MAG: patatin-like phospholipase family protein [Bacteroidales bacterium]|nr:patatin-like phospholipase family protein [Bacteroidales bacterium]MDD3522478.1 patatin-like phospholipase family protein [Bacteroidales bacterium]MDD4031175.1 patatin-like phospholipase family protein [Bacteroidales bacterium]MDD4435489.1 patatin-like phospholipase family protein [Bacteroidales bacterium]MDD5732384.1 patatin-like phospholipase family protein [Bacteroidales bacterium]
MKRMVELGIAFGGGGTRGYYHAGVLKRLLELGYKPQIVSGTSVGAIVAAMYAQGLSVESMIDAFNMLTLKDFLAPRIPKEYLTDSKPVRLILEKTLQAKTFEALEIPLKIVATCLESGKEVVFESGSLIDAVIASCSVPVVFPPVRIQGKHYVDGGVIRNVPVSVIRGECKKVLAVNLFPVAESEVEYSRSMKHIAERCVTMLLNAGASYDLGLADLVIQDVEMAGYSTYDFKHREEMFNLGYNARALRLLDKMG